jgi:phage replication O-like protein O
MANVQKENGFTSIANDLVEALSRLSITNYDFRVLMVILRMTYGWRKKECFLSISEISNMTGIKTSNVSRSLKSLANKNIIIRNQSTMIQKDFEKWVINTPPPSNEILSVQRHPPPSNEITFTPSLEGGAPSNKRGGLCIKERIKEKKESGVCQFPPKIQEIVEFCETNKFSINPHAFFDHYESNGWMVGKVKMKDWQAAVRSWEHRNKPSTTTEDLKRYL